MSNWDRVKKIASASALCLLYPLLASCSSEPEVKDLGKELCAIYRSVLTEEGGEKSSSFIQAIELSEKIKEELPDYYANHHVNIAAVAPEKQYEMISMVIEYETNEPWECPEAEKRFTPSGLAI